jgi:hypothetical protein
MCTSVHCANLLLSSGKIAAPLADPGHVTVLEELEIGLKRAREANLRQIVFKSMPGTQVWLQEEQANAKSREMNKMQIAGST